MQFCAGNETQQGVADAKDEARIGPASGNGTGQVSRVVPDEEGFEEERVEDQGPRGREEAERECFEAKAGRGHGIEVRIGMILTPLQKLPSNKGNLGKIIVATSFECLPKKEKITQSGHTDWNRGFSYLLRPDNIHLLCKGKFHCKADLLFGQFGFCRFCLH